MPKTVRVVFEPLGRRVEVHPGQTILSAAQANGVGLASVCGGSGTCEECRIRLASGRLTPPTLVEQAALGGSDLAGGFRLACQAEPLSDVQIDIPPESLTTSQRLQVEGLETPVAVRPFIISPDAYGLAVDIGTTKLAAYIIHLKTGKVATKAGAMNPQIAFGEDVISRIAYVGREAKGAKRLQSALVDSLDRILVEMCAQAHVSRSSILDAVFVGNTIMHHLFAGLPVEQLGYAPFSPATTQPLTMLASDIGLSLGSGAKVYLPPVIAGYVGSDHLAMLMASLPDSIINTFVGVRRNNKETSFSEILNLSSSRGAIAKLNIIALDIGTNTEIALLAGGNITCCSCASGPAFEGAHIREGMRAAPGAIERARWSSGKILWQTIDNLPPVGICGSGILDVVAALQDGALVKRTGVLQKGAGSEIVLVPAAQTGLGRDLVVTRKDVNEIQLAKSAIRVGVEILLKDAGLTYTDLDNFIVAGAFGTYLDLRSAVRTGMFPPLPPDRFHQVGNAAGVGAKQMLISVDKRREAETLARKIRYTELTNHASFTPLFMDYLCFEL